VLVLSREILVSTAAGYACVYLHWHFRKDYNSRVAFASLRSAQVGKAEDIGLVVGSTPAACRCVTLKVVLSAGTHVAGTFQHEN
jgi:hypothetical protein